MYPKNRSDRISHDYLHTFELPVFPDYYSRCSWAVLDCMDMYLWSWTHSKNRRIDQDHRILRDYKVLENSLARRAYQNIALKYNGFSIDENIIKMNNVKGKCIISGVKHTYHSIPCSLHLLAHTWPKTTRNSNNFTLRVRIWGFFLDWNLYLQKKSMSIIYIFWLY